MTYYGVVLLMSGYQADEKNILKQYKIFVDKCVETYVSMTAVFLTFYMTLQARREIPHWDTLDPKPSEGIFPHRLSSSLTFLTQAKILRMSGDAAGAIATLQAGLSPDRTSVFLQADALLVFELAWVYLSQRRYEDSAKAFMRMTEINTWSHATYYFIAAGCQWSLGNFEEAQRLLEATPAQIDKRKIGAKDLPTEVFIKKKRASLF